MPTREQGSARHERRRLRKPWEEARRVALEPPEAFELAIALVDDPACRAGLGSTGPRIWRRDVDADVNHPDFRRGGSAVRRRRLCGVDHLRQGPCGRRSAPQGPWHEVRTASTARSRRCARACGFFGSHLLWMLHENGTPDATPTEFQVVLNQLMPRLDGMMWAGPGIVADESVDLESLDADELWPGSLQKNARGGGDRTGSGSGQGGPEGRFESCCGRALGAARDDIGAPMSSPPIDAGEGVPEPEFKSDPVPQTGVRFRAQVGARASSRS